MKIVIDRDIPYIKGVLEAHASVSYVGGAEISAADVADADALIVRTRTQCNAALLGGSRVRTIATATIGFDHIDTQWCAAHAIKVTTAAGCNARGVLQWFAAVMAHLSAKQGWKPSDRTLGVVGVGNVGSLVAQYGKMWGFKVLCCDPPKAERGEKGFVDHREIVSQCNIITYHTPLTRDGLHPTFHLFDSHTVNNLRPDTIILNSSRGEVIDSRAATEAIERGATVAIDTWEHEPHMDAELLRTAEIATPHIAGYSAAGKAMATSMAVKATARELGISDLEAWYPTDAARSCATSISWTEMCTKMPQHFDISALSDQLKRNHDLFEQMRNKYQYRTEFF